ncbi:MmpS family protein [Streptomyces sp. MMG1121]|uniref:MmpS family protein n=1 Tax=Streptomyces sp. MMG1121 TaxID=1415544 RepID=UPI0006C43608|nr:MmpS family protein [Streptomyces sp. MMG1121]KOV66192.1 hypothetical protein ADK64_11385 [Streptomyces sp. MMG1121]
MSNQPPQHPGWAGPQHPFGQAPHGRQPYGQPPFQPQPPKKGPGAGKVIGFGCLGLVGVAVALGIAAAAVSGSGSNDSGSSGSKSTSTTTTGNKTAADAKGDSKGSGAPKTVVFKIWGTAPAGALGGLDINYGSDSDTRKGVFKNGKFEATLPLKKGAMYYTLNAQLQGSGDINCSVTVDGQTKSGHASGGYNICDAQLSGDFTGGWQ